MVTVYLFIIFFLVCLNFLLPHLLPDDAILAMYSDSETQITVELYNELIKLHGLDKTLYKQFITFPTQLAHGDLGYSYMYHVAQYHFIVIIAMCVISSLMST